jgi:hypothetical protein
MMSKNKRGYEFFQSNAPLFLNPFAQMIEQMSIAPL